MLRLSLTFALLASYMQPLESMNAEVSEAGALPQPLWREAPQLSQAFRDKMVFDHVDGSQTWVVEEPPTHESSQPLPLSAWAEHLALQRKGAPTPSELEHKPTKLQYTLGQNEQQPVASSRRTLFDSPVHTVDYRGEIPAKPTDATPTTSENPYPIPDSEWRFIPEYVGSIFPEKTIKWEAKSYKESACFPSMTAVASGVQLGETNNNTIVITFHLQHAKSVLCSDLYLLATPTSWHVQRLTHKVLSYKHVLTWQGLSDAEIAEIQVNGIRVFHFLEGVAGLLSSIFETSLLFSGDLVQSVPGFAAKDNVDFLAQYTIYNLTKRVDHGADMGTNPSVRSLAAPLTYIVPEEEIHSGDMFCIVRLDGLDPMIMWGTGSPCGHTVMALWIPDDTSDENEKTLYIVESQTRSAYWPTPFVQRNEYRKWMDLAQAATYNVLYLPLTKEARDAFNEEEAVNFFVNDMEGLLYGFQNFLSGWIDVGDDNMPAPLSVELVNVGFALVDPILQPVLDKQEPVAIPSLWNDLLAQRLGLISSNGTKLYQDNITTAELYTIAQQKGISFETLLNLKEEDAWVYPAGVGHRAGPASVCDVFVCRMWKAAGLFKDLKDEVQCSEFVPLDVVQMNMLDAQYEPAQECLVVGPDGQKFCQIMGEYALFVPGFGQVGLFPGMREQCPSKAPDYASRLSTDVMNTC